MTNKIPVGISECLLGSEVRYNGGHKQMKLCTNVLSQHFEFVPTCPEMNVGLGVPRSPVRLVDFDGEVKVRGTDNPDQDVTEALHTDALSYLAKNPTVCGLIVTRGSPSCGLYSVKVYHQNGNPLSKSSGAFSQAVMDAAPYLPIEDSGRLNDALLRETFITAVYTLHDWKQTVAHSDEKSAIIGFHSRHKLLLMSHSISTYKSLGKLLGDLKGVGYNTLKEHYINAFMRAIKTPTTRGRHCNALQHLQGYLKTHINKTEKSSLSKTISDYREGYIPLIVPMTLLKHYANLHFDAGAYINSQSYLDPYPDTLGLRNDI